MAANFILIRAFSCCPMPANCWRPASQTTPIPTVSCTQDKQTCLCRRRQIHRLHRCWRHWLPSLSLSTVRSPACARCARPSDRLHWPAADHRARKGRSAAPVPAPARRVRKAQPADGDHVFDLPMLEAVGLPVAGGSNGNDGDLAAVASARCATRSQH